MKKQSSTKEKPTGPKAPKSPTTTSANARAIAKATDTAKLPRSASLVFKAKTLKALRKEIANYDMCLGKETHYAGKKKESSENIIIEFERAGIEPKQPIVFDEGDALGPKASLVHNAGREYIDGALLLEAGVKSKVIRACTRRSKSSTSIRISWPGRKKSNGRNVDSTDDSEE